jgi:hypothetical protein
MKEYTFDVITLSRLSVRDFRLPHIKTLINAFFPEVFGDINGPHFVDTFANTSGAYLLCVCVCVVFVINQLCA